MVLDESKSVKTFTTPTFMQFHSALDTFELQNHAVEEHCGAEKVPLVSLSASVLL